MRTEKQIEASRLNGAKSRGPVTAEGKRISAANAAFSTGPRTPEGKARSSKNAEKRQILANSIALPAERNEEFLELLHDYRASLRPVGFLEERVVETITVSDWHRRRYWMVSMAHVAHATGLQEQSMDAYTLKCSQENAATPTALAIGNLVDHGRSLEFFRRCDSGYSREYRNARKELKELQAERFKLEQSILDDGPVSPLGALAGDSLDFETWDEPEPENIAEPTEPSIPFRGVGANEPAPVATNRIKALTSPTHYFPFSADSTPTVSAGNPNPPSRSAPSVSAGKTNFLPR